MQKTKLGITVGLLGAALYFTGLLNFLGLLILAGYVLLFETNEWLKKSAVKAVAIEVFFFLFTVIIGFGNDIFGILNNILALLNIHFSFVYPLHLDSIVTNFAYAAEKLTMLILGFKALTQGGFSVKPVDNLINKNM